MKRNLVRIIGIMLLLALAVTPIFAQGQQDEASDALTATMATDVGGLGDKSFNDSAYAGLVKANAELGVEINVVESKEFTDYVPNLSGLAEDGSDVVFAVGYLMDSAVKEVAANYPDHWFAGIDIETKGEAPSNFIGVQYNEHEAGYLAGIVAGMMTKEYAGNSPKLNDENVVGVVLGMLVPAVEKFEVGFIQGVHYVNPTCEVLSIVVDSFTDSAKGKEAALSMIEKGADIVFQAAGGAGIGAIQACNEAGVFAIGVDTDQNGVAPATVLTSATKGVAQSVYLVVESVVNGTAEGGDVVYGINENAVGLASFNQHDSIVPQAVKDEVAKAIVDIKAGKRVIETSRAAIGR
jgi:basic membrane protein A and related proteins